MVFGYSILDPIVVLLGAGLAVHYLTRGPVRLIGFLPAALSLYFFIPLGSFLTLGRVIPMLLTLRLFLKPRIPIPRGSGPILLVLVFSILFSAAFSGVIGANTGRTIFRTLNYVGLLALFLFAFEMGRKPEAGQLLVRGLAVVAIVFSLYGAYQVFAYFTGLPMRGIVYGPNSAGAIPVLNGLPRINSLANEPKRLGYVLFVGALALFQLARTERSSRARRWFIWGTFAILVSIMTLSMSYLLTVVAFAGIALLLYPTSAIRLLGPFLVAGALVVGLGSQFGAVEALRGNFGDRLTEVEVGLDGRFVFRQEFFANEYLDRYPVAILTGVGLGRYNEVLNKEFGAGAGYGEQGQVMQLNSSHLELIFDLGLPATAAFYIGNLLLVFRLRRERQKFLSMVLLFLVLQSLTIHTVQFCILVAGVALGQLAVRGPRPSASGAG